ncbi:amidohydrolase [Bacillus sp. T33-2]|nr:amidohydrolase [Bacillus sp. T33-2]
MNPIDYFDQHRESLMKTYHNLHTLAEPSWEEAKTSEYIKGCLQRAGLTVHTFHGHYGLIAEIPGQTNQVVALRADMDALVQEVNGKVKPNHSCGHDAHSTMVLHTALAIAASGMSPRHTLRFIFQPAEEKGEGALRMMVEGALKDVAYLFGVHLRPESEVPYMKASPVIVHGAALTINGSIKGRQAHAARPHEGINVIEAAAVLVHDLKQIQLDTEVPYSIKMTKLQTENEAANVIPETARFAIDARAQSNEVMERIIQCAEAAFKIAEEKTGASLYWTLDEYVPAASLNQNAMELAESAIAKIIGKENVIPVCLSQGGEDFHFYTAKNPSLQATMIGLGCGLSPGLHHPQMNFNLEALVYGAKILTETVWLASET